MVNFKSLEVEYAGEGNVLTSESELFNDVIEQHSETNDEIVYSIITEANKCAYYTSNDTLFKNAELLNDSVEEAFYNDVILNPVNLVDVLEGGAKVYYYNLLMSNFTQIAFNAMVAHLQDYHGKDDIEVDTVVLKQLLMFEAESVEDYETFDDLSKTAESVLKRAIIK